METIILDNDIEYFIVKEELINNNLYTLFANVDDNTDICFRKTIIEDDGEKYYIGLDDDKEFDLVAAHFSKSILKEIDK